MKRKVDSAPNPAEARPFQRRVAGNFVSLASGELAGRLIGFIATVYVARTLGVADYGVIGFALAIVLYLWAFLDWGVELYGPRVVAERSERIPDIISALLTFRLTVATVVATIVALAGLFVLPQPEGRVLAIYGLTLYGVAANPRWALLGMDRSRPVAVSRVVFELLKAGLIVLLVRGPQDLTLVPVIHFLGDALAAAYLIVVLVRAGQALHLRFDLRLVRQLLRRSTPLMTMTVLGLVIYNADLILLRVFRDRTDVGIYLAAFALITFLGQLAQVSRLSLIPTLTKIRDDRSLQEAVAQTASSQLAVLALPICIGGFLVARPLIELVFGPAYGASGTVLQILIWTIPLLLLRSVMEAVLISNQRQDRVLRETSLAASLNIALNLVAIPLFGLIGAAVTTLVAEVVRSLLALTYVRRDGVLSVVLKRLWRPAVSAAVMAFGLQIIELENVLLAIPAGALIYVGALALTGGVRFRRGQRPELSV